MTWRPCFLACVSIVAACSAPATSPGEPSAVVSGTRLQARQWTAPGVAPLTVAIFDGERHQECQFRTATDGKLRCLPVSEDLVESGDCADPACQQPLYRHQGMGACDGVTDDYLTVPRPPSACPGEVTYEVRRLVPVPAGSRSYHPDGSEAGTGDPGALMVVETVAPERWVEGRASSTAGTARLSVRQVESVDGGRFAVGLLDEHWNRPCTLLADTPGETLRCWPASASGDEALFSDPSCKVPLAVPDEMGCEAPLVVREASGLFAAGERWTGKVFALRGHTPCVEVPHPAAIYTIGAPLAPGVLAVVQPVTEGTGRLRPKRLREATGPTFSPPLDAVPALARPFDDVEQGGACLPVHTRSAGLRCLTVTGCDGWPSPFFADAGCSERLASCAAATRPIVSYRPWPTCHLMAADSVRSSDGEVSGTAMYFGAPGACTALPDQGTPRLLLGAALGDEEEKAFWAGFPRLDIGVAPARP
jgi:hypothetical protein